MSALDDMKAAAAEHMDMAKRRQAAVEALEYMVQQLALLGLGPITEMDERGFFVLRFDPDLIEVHPVAGDGEGPDPDAPEVMPVASCEGGGVAMVEPAPDPEVTSAPAKAVQRSTPKTIGFVSGPWSADDESYLVNAVRQGKPRADIAAHLNRSPKDVSNKRFRLKDRILSAYAPARPPARPVKAKEAKPKPAKPAPEAVAKRQKMTAKRWMVHLEDLGTTGTWTPARDLLLVRHIARGAGVAGAGALLKIGSEDAHVRWKQLKGTDETLSDDAMEALIEALEARLTE